jgi:predicted RNA-binding Zn-ribbon protein involved in translation (DUF1610 family)
LTTAIPGPSYKLFDAEDKRLTRPQDLASILCPKCREVGMISEPHTIDSHGNVSPVWQCDKCGFADVLQLQDFRSAD